LLVNAFSCSSIFPVTAHSRSSTFLVTAYSGSSIFLVTAYSRSSIFLVTVYSCSSIVLVNAYSGSSIFLVTAYSCGRAEDREYKGEGREGDLFVIAYHVAGGGRGGRPHLMSSFCINVRPARLVERAAAPSGPMPFPLREGGSEREHKRGGGRGVVIIIIVWVYFPPRHLYAQTQQSARTPAGRHPAGRHSGGKSFWRGIIPDTPVGRPRPTDSERGRRARRKEGGKEGGKRKGGMGE
jgi:hypothetical protein